MQPPSTYSGMYHVNLRETYIEDMDRLTETMHGEASAFSGILMGQPIKPVVPDNYSSYFCIQGTVKNDIYSPHNKMK